MKKLAFHLMAISLAIVVLELLLTGFGLGLTYFHKRENFKNSSERPNSVTILCIGESTTAWGLSESYPAQLQKELNRIYGEGYYAVINAGVAATDSSEILKNLESDLEKFSPQIVITMLGINDFWKISDDTKFYDNLHLYKFFKLFKHNLPIMLKRSSSAPEIVATAEPEKSSNELSYLMATDKTLEEAKAALDVGNSSRALSLFKKFTTKYNTSEANQMVGLYYYFKFGVFHAEGQKIARLFFKKSLELDAQNAAALTYLGCSYSLLDKDYPQALPHLERAFELGRREADTVGCLADLLIKSNQPGRAEQVLNSVLDHKTSFSIWTRLIDVSIQLRKFDQAKEVLQNAEKLFPNNLVLKTFEHQIEKELGNIDSLAPNSVSVENFFDFKVTQTNYLKIAKILNTRGLKHVVMNYPRRSIEPLKQVLVSYPEIVYVANQDNFEMALRQHKFEDLFIDSFGGNFGHFTLLGSQIIAKNIVKELQAKKVLPPVNL